MIAYAIAAAALAGGLVYIDRQNLKVKAEQERATETPPDEIDMEVYVFLLMILWLALTLVPFIDAAGTIA